MKTIASSLIGFFLLLTLSVYGQTMSRGDEHPLAASILPAADEESGTLGSIRGGVMGAASSTASMFSLRVYGPDNPMQLAGQIQLPAHGGFVLEGLSRGKYWIQISCPVPTAITASLTREEVVIADGNPQTVEVLLR